MSTQAIINNPEAQIASSRTLRAPRELVFQMFTDAEHISNWWGPRGFTTKTERMDVRPGGMWIHTMVSAEGVEYPSEVRFVEIDAPSRIIYDHLDDPLFRATITFTDNGDGTTEVHKSLNFASKELRDTIVQQNGAVEGLKDTLARFEEVVSTHGVQEFVITREFDAPRELVYMAWTEPKHLEQWFGPADNKAVIKQADIRPGGKMIYSMKTPNGGTIWGRWSFRELNPPSRIVLVLTFIDEQENPVPHPYVPALPPDSLSTTTFEEKDGKTLVTLRSQAMYASDEGRVAFRNLFGGMQQGWTGVFDALDEHLKTL